MSATSTQFAGPAPAASDAESAHADPPESIGWDMHALLRELLPHFRGLSGEGNRQTLGRLAELIPLDIHEVASGGPAFDWTVPDQWRFRDAYVRDHTGQRIIDAQALNLHVVTHSQPVHQTMSWSQLRTHLYTRPDMPAAVPYRHTFYEPSWGFCLSQNQLERIEADNRGPYEVCIDADLSPGKAGLVYGQCVLPGAKPEEVLFSAHSCHPSMANDNLSGVVVQAYLAKMLAQRHRRLTYRFVFAPATIGALTWLSRNQDQLHRIVGGLVLANLGDAARLTYQRSRPGNTAIDQAAASILPRDQLTHFTPTGGDERQFGSPGLNLPVGALMRSGPGEYREYHTSADDADFVKTEQLAGALNSCIGMCDRLENMVDFTDAPGSPKESMGEISPTKRGASHAATCGELQLGRRGVLAAIAREPDPATLHCAVLWTLNLTDGQHDPQAIATRSGLPPNEIKRASELLKNFGLPENDGQVQ